MGRRGEPLMEEDGWQTVQVTSHRSLLKEHEQHSADVDVSILRRQLAAEREVTAQLRLRVMELEAALDRVAEGGASAASAAAKFALRELRPAADADRDPNHEETKRLIEHLRNEACVQLAPSKIAGVGVVAFRSIPAGVDPFTICNSHFAPKERFSVLSSGDLRKFGLEKPVIDQVRSFFAPLTEQDGWTPQRDDEGEVQYGVLATGLASLNMSWYLNHSDEPNVAFKDAEEEGTFNSYVTRRRIEEGEELTVDYRELGSEYYAFVSGG